jgi:hypothetical protein
VRTYEFSETCQFRGEIFDDMTTRPLLVMALLLCCACGAPPEDVGPEGASPPQAQNVGEADVAAVALEKGPSAAAMQGMGYIAGDEPLAWKQPGFIQRYTAVNFNSVIVTDFAQLASGEWESLSHQSSASFVLMTLASGSLDDFVLLGFTRDDYIVVERWTLVEGSGSVVTFGGGGTGPSELLRPKVFQKERLFKGAAGQRPVDVEMDPDGRYVVFGTTTSDDFVTIFQLDCTDPNAVPLVLADSSTIPELSDARDIQKFEHVILGRVFVVSTIFSDWQRIVFVDANNDGIFDGSPLVGDDAFFEAQGLDQYEYWINLNR